MSERGSKEHVARNVGGRATALGLLLLGTLAQPALATGKPDLPTEPVSLVFKPNLGQTSEDISFLANGPGFVASVRPSGVTLRSSDPAGSCSGQVEIEVSWEGANLLGTWKPESAAPGVSHYYRGGDPQEWVVNVPHYQSLRYDDLYDGIDLMLRSDDGTMEKVWFVGPSADPSLIVTSFEDASALELDEAGNLVVTLPCGQLVQRAPVAYQFGNPTARRVDATYVIEGHVVKLALGDYDPDLEVVIDPALQFSTYVGGDAEDQASGVAVHRGRTACISGRTLSSDLLPTGPRPGTLDSDAFVACFDREGSFLLWSAYLGGTGDDSANSLAITETGDAVVVGVTASLDFPIANAFQTSFGGGAKDAFVARLGPGGVLAVSSYLGGGGDDHAEHVDSDRHANAVTGNLRAYVAGWTNSGGASPFPTGCARSCSFLQTSNQGATDAFLSVVRLSFHGAPSSGLPYSTYLGGSGDDQATGVGTDRVGGVYVSGTSSSQDLPATSGAFQTLPVGVPDAFVARLAVAGWQMEYLTYLGGSGAEGAASLAPSTDGQVTIAGHTYSTDFPVVAPIQSQKSGPTGTADSFVARLVNDGSALSFSTYLGGAGDDFAGDVAVDPLAIVHVAGETSSPDFPGATGYHGGRDGFAVRISGSGAVLEDARYVGGEGDESVSGIALDYCGNPYIVGTTNSTTFPTVSPGVLPPYQSALSVPDDAFLAKLERGSGVGAELDLVLTNDNLPSVATHTVCWNHVNGAVYDVVRGELGLLRTFGGDYSLAVTDCTWDNRTLSEILGSDPAVDVFYLARTQDALGMVGTYDSGGSGQTGLRDMEIAGSGGNCPP